MEPRGPQDLMEFPCHYQFKAVGNAGEEFVDAIVKAVGTHADVPADAVKTQPSGKGTYQSVSVLTTLHSYQQLTDIYAEMKKCPGLKMLL